MKLCFNAFLTLALAISLAGCQKNDEVISESSSESSSKLAPDGFNFSTTREVSIDIRLLSNQDEAISKTFINIKSSYSDIILFRGLTDDNGYLKTKVNLPSYMETLIINPENPGLGQGYKGLITNNAINCVIGGKAGISGDIIRSSSSGKTLQNNSSRIFATTYSYMGTLDNSGRPLDYLTQTKGAVSANLLSYLAAALPDQQDVRTHHPQYVSDNATEHLNIVQLSDIWITFVAEGAGNLNSIGYYEYKTNNPPATAADIQEIKLLFPNASALGTGGSMQAGDRVHLGRFEEGTSIGFVLFAFGWQGGNMVHVNNPKFYSDSKFNPEPNAALQSHTVLLNYVNENQFVIGFEDLNRTDPQCDHDFNDVILYATSNPVTAISTKDVSTMGPATDTDGDGVYDNNDEFPTDPARAYTSYYPSKSTFGTLGFEDNWPAKGDYDMNDVVVKYNYAYVHNSNNNVLDMTGRYVLQGAMADFANGFGLQLPFAPGIVSSVTGQRRTENYITHNSNGTEAGQTKAVIIPFDNHKTIAGITDTVKVKLAFNSPVHVSTIIGAPYNPFLISNKNRGTEIHLPGSLPTNKADLNLLGTKHDNSNAALNKYYLSADNWPWAINFSQGFNYPKEGVPINEAYLRFADWASSAGGSYTDWYTNTAVGYRVLNKIHQ